MLYTNTKGRGIEGAMEKLFLQPLEQKRKPDPLVFFRKYWQRKNQPTASTVQTHS